MPKKKTAKNELRATVAQSCRMLEHEGLIDYSGHVSARDPDGKGYWIHTLEKPRHMVTPSDVIKVSLDGHVLSGKGMPPSEKWIHSEIYRVRPDVGAVAHLHPLYTNSLTIAGYNFVPVVQHGAMFGESLPMLDDSRHVDSKEQGEKLAQTLGNYRAALIRGHGVAVIGSDMVDCFTGCIFLEDNAKHLWQALGATGGRMDSLHGLKSEEIAHGMRHFDIVNQRQRGSAKKIWDYYLQRII
jgi:L-ribulose-5-phosphate 4-epimerase